MKCSSRKAFLFPLACLLCLALCACGMESSYDFPYDMMNRTRALSEEDIVPFFSRDYCVGPDRVSNEALTVTFGEDESAGLFDLNRREVLYAHRIHERMDPASMTKVLTALVALEHGSLDMRLTASTSFYITDKDAQILDMEKGESMTLHQALHFLLVFSANDVAMMIAEHVGGSVEHFMDMMNEKCRELGATASHFSNPHGLTEPDHYTTAYDMYLIFQAAMQYETFQEIIRLPSYKTQYYDSRGVLKEAEVNSTNGFLRVGAGYSAPAGVTVIGGKTGTTYAAGQCLILLARDVNGDPHIAVCMHASDRPALYAKMTALLSLTVKTDT